MPKLVLMCDHGDLGMGSWAPVIQPALAVEHRSVLACPHPVGWFRMVAIVWSAARAGAHPRDPATVAMRSWARRTTQRYQGALYKLADSEEGCAVPTGLAACLSQFLAVKVANGAPRSSLRNITSAVCGAEDLGLWPPIVAPLHRRLPKGGQP